MRSNGYRRRTRKLFSKDFRKHGNPSLTKTLYQFQMNDLVDIKVEPSVVKGMPHKYYHGRTGKVFNCNPRSYGILLYRTVGHKRIERHIHVRPKHLQISRCAEETKRRHREHTKLHLEARAKGMKHVAIKRQPKGPMPAFSISKKNNEPIEVTDKPYLPVF